MQGSGFRVQGYGLRVLGFGFRVRILGIGFWALGWFTVFGFWVSNSGFRISESMVEGQGGLRSMPINSTTDRRLSTKHLVYYPRHTHHMQTKHEAGLHKERFRQRSRAQYLSNLHPGA